jgi:hypothetical protein
MTRVGLGADRSDEGSRQPNSPRLVKRPKWAPSGTSPALLGLAERRYADGAASRSPWIFPPPVSPRGARPLAAPSGPNRRATSMRSTMHLRSNERAEERWTGFNCLHCLVHADGARYRDGDGGCRNAGQATVTWMPQRWMSPARAPASRPRHRDCAPACGRGRGDFHQSQSDVVRRGLRSGV